MGEAKYYWVNDKSIISRLSGFIQSKVNTTVGYEVNDSRSMISAIQNDKYAIGFCKFADIFDSESQGISEEYCPVANR